MKKGLTELVFILDKSGSMHGLERDTIGGFNSLIDERKAAGDDVLVSTVLFSNASQVLHDRVRIADIGPLTEKDYRTDGCTALIDAIGGAVKHISTVHRYIRSEDVPEHTLFVITTDGMENASRKWSSDEVKKMIEEKKKEGWEFLFLGANIDSVSTAAAFGIGEEYAVDYCANPAGTRENFKAVGKALCCMMDEGAVSFDWADDVKELNEKHKR